MKVVGEDTLDMMNGDRIIEVKAMNVMNGDWVIIRAWCIIWGMLRELVLTEFLVKRLRVRDGRGRAV